MFAYNAVCSIYTDMDPHKYIILPTNKPPQIIKEQELEKPNSDKSPHVITEKEIEIIDKMFDDSMNNRWKEVLSTYRAHRFAREAKLTKSEDTALHLAINCYHPNRHQSKGHLQYIKDMVNNIPKDEVLDVLKLKNDAGDTPLHLAAQLGDVDICKCILSKVENLNLHKSHELISERNKLNKTPLFLAAHRGKLDAFRLLHKEIKEREDRIHLCRKEKGETILHSTLSGEYFELADEIIETYPELVNYVNEDGTSPLHILARKPHAFKSSSYLGSYESIIYYCTEVRAVKSTEDDANDHFSFPENWRTLVDISEIIWNAVMEPIWSFIRNTFERKTAKENHSTPKVNDLEKQDSQTQAFERKTEKGNDPTTKVNGLEKQDSQPQGNIKNTKMQEDQMHVGAFPRIYYTDIGFLKFVMKVMLIILGIGFRRISKIKEKKAKHTWAVRILEKLIQKEASYKYQHAGGKPLQLVEVSNKPIDLPMTPPPTDDSSQSDTEKIMLEKKENHPDSNKNSETPILAAAKMGIQEIVEKIIKTFPVSIQDLDPNQKNVLLLAVENRQVAVYDFLRKQKLPEFVYYQVDNKGNSAVHLAAMYNGLKYWRIPGDALQLQGEVKWYKYVKSHMPRESYVRYNNEGQTPQDVFLETHTNLTKLGTTWLTKTSESCSVIAALIATVAFAASTTVPGGLNQETGYPILEGQPAFSAFAVSSLIALCFSVTSLVFFLAILTSRCQQKDFKNNLPIKLLLGLTSLFTSIAAILISFCAGHSFIIKSKLKVAAFPIYGVVCLPVTFFAFNQLPLYLDLFRSIIQPVHFRSFRVSYTGKPKGDKESSSSKNSSSSKQ